MIEFTSDIPEDALNLLMKLGEQYCFDPVSSNESEVYFSNLISCYNGKKDELSSYLKAQVKTDFKVLKEFPDWLQSADWQFNRGKPMCFVGDMEAKLKRDGAVYGIKFYVFWDIETGETRTITQFD